MSLMLFNEDDRKGMIALATLGVWCATFILSGSKMPANATSETQHFASQAMSMAVTGRWAKRDGEWRYIKIEPMVVSSYEGVSGWEFGVDKPNIAMVEASPIATASIQGTIEQSSGRWIKKNNRWIFDEGDDAPLSTSALGPIAIQGTHLAVDKMARTYSNQKARSIESGWKKIGSSWSFVTASSVAAEPEMTISTTGWIKSGGQWNYTAPTIVSQKSATAPQRKQSKQAIAASSGGWFKISGRWTYKDSSYSPMITSALPTKVLPRKSEQKAKGRWSKITGKWVWGNGQKKVSKRGWSKINGTWTWMEPSVTIKTGWVRTNGKWRYFSKKTSSETRYI